MDKNELKKIVCESIDAKSIEIIAFGEACEAIPELGYKEHKTSAVIKARLAEYGVGGLKQMAVTGVTGRIKGRNSSASVMILGELDAVISPRHPLADPETGAAHACGHAAQLAVLAGCAAGINAVRAHLDGDVIFAACPAEEYVQIGERQEMRAEGKISWLGGKQQMIAEGVFDGADIAMMVHAAAQANDNSDGSRGHVVAGGSSLGFIGKEIRFTGKEAHAGVAPWHGINALNAANLAMQAINALRETFRDTDKIRVHPIITKGGDIVSTVPADVRMECFVRAGNLEAMARTNAAVNRAVRGAAYALGAEVRIDDIPGYLPLEQNPCICKMFVDNAKQADRDIITDNVIPFGGSTDMGDVSWLLPAIHPSINGFTGLLHSADFSVSDRNLAYILPAKLLAMTAVDLLADKAEQALMIKSKYPRKTKEQYAAAWDKILKSGG